MYAVTFITKQNHTLTKCERDDKTVERYDGIYGI